MRAELPWNVAGIPPEAREAARAAARREGLSVGEWLTRRILRSFSDLGEEAPPAPSYERGPERSVPLDPWGLPPPSSSRRDTEDMLNRVSRTEAESSDSFRRIEEHLRSVSRRLDSAERSQSDNYRAMNKAASEINIASREQAQVFDQIGGHVVGINDRLERLERAATQDGLKDAVKGLHQGLSRLADQISQTANQSAQQVTAISGSLEQLAGRLGQVRTEVEATTRRLETRVSAIEEESRTRFSAFEAEVQRNLDQRLAAVEKSAQFNTNALDRALERLEAQAGIRAGDQAELQKRHAETDGAISRVEESIERLEAQNSDPAVERRLDSIERALGSLVSRLETYDPTAPLEDTLRGLVRRIDSVEKNHGEMMDELRANLAGGAKPAIGEPAYDPALFDPKSFDSKPFAAPESNFEAPPFAETVPTFGGESFVAGDAPPLAEQDPFAADSFATGAFAPADDEAIDPASENFLAAARRSARAAAEAENSRGGRLGFAWGSSPAAAEGAEPARSRLTVPLIVGIIIVLALFAGVVVSQRLKAGHQAQPAAPQAAARNNAPFTPAPQVMPSPASPGIKLPFLGSARPAKPAAPASLQPVLPPLPKAPAPASPQASTQAGNPSGAPQLFAPAPKGGPVPTLDRVTQLANSGNAIAETILGLKELDGDGVPANPADAAKWLERAAQQGQAVAQYRLGSVYERGQGVTANAATAVRWYQLAANQGNRKAMHNLAVANASGAGGKKDMAEAARWFAKAADLGLADSQFNLAVLYERGDGVPQSLLDAYKWYAIAAGQGDAESKSRLSVLSTQLSDDDRNAAQKSAATFHAAPLNRAANVPPEMADLTGN
jgi:localization factor PodJL